MFFFVFLGHRQGYDLVLPSIKLLYVSRTLTLKPTFYPLFMGFQIIFTVNSINLWDFVIARR